MFGSEKNKNSRFYIKSDDQITTLGTGSGLTPLLDKNGETIVE